MLSIINAISARDVRDNQRDQIRLVPCKASDHQLYCGMLSEGTPTVTSEKRFGSSAIGIRDAMSLTRVSRSGDGGRVRGEVRRNGRQEVDEEMKDEDNIRVHTHMYVRACSGV